MHVLNLKKLILCAKTFWNVHPDKNKLNKQFWLFKAFIFILAPGSKHP
jgi:hypothetical protein